VVSGAYGDLIRRREAAKGNLGTVMGIRFGYNGFGGDAEAVEAPACKAGLSGFESHRHLHSFLFAEMDELKKSFYDLVHDSTQHDLAFENQIVAAFRSIPPDTKGVALMQVMPLLKQFGGTMVGV
jgi:hypothetical protein